MRNRDSVLQSTEQLINMIHALERSVGPTMVDPNLKQSLLYQPIEQIKEKLEFIHSLVSREPDTY